MKSVNEYVLVSMHLVMALTNIFLLIETALEREPQAVVETDCIVILEILRLFHMSINKQSLIMDIQSHTFDK